MSSGALRLTIDGETANRGFSPFVGKTFPAGYRMIPGSSQSTARKAFVRELLSKVVNPDFSAAALKFRLLL